MFRVKGLGLRVKGLGFVVDGLWFRVNGLRFRVSALGPRVQGFGFRVGRVLGDAVCRALGTSGGRTDSAPDLRLIDLEYHSTLGLRVIKKKNKVSAPTAPPLYCFLAPSHSTGVPRS